MSARLRGIARETERIVAEGGYRTPGGATADIAAAVAEARAGTRLYGPAPVAVPGQRAEEAAEATVFEVTAEGSLDAARRLAVAGPEQPVAVLDFASARNPGGGYLNGAQAQEEALCRGSALYACLREVPEFYAAHRADPSPFYSDRVVHAPGVPVFRDDRGTLLDTPYRAGFLAAAAPNAGVIARRTPEEVPRVAAALTSRAERVLQVAAAHGYRQLVLGAWGCGVFRNEPRDVAGAFADHLTGTGRFAGRFGRVVFAVLDRRADSPTRAAFAERFAAGT
ncbi:TIGR02452 family protein [Streptomyces sp. AV19]|uniref:TIGR02452 family protein n=1 Tax=Streptomyces sp. AV19 TaxID=2793068 RepID=UPI0018FE3531|nr:TIGR02452 family protein [Streptomyces sp. AV19]MBH1937934.1 TIGR02452 family protein [Streptomyces sp. AV19]MDG4536572.1 TIGR02452 family protein [Streptomyces sp. AV19]